MIRAFACMQACHLEDPVRPDSTEVRELNEAVNMAQIDRQGLCGLGLSLFERQTQCSAHHMAAVGRSVLQGWLRRCDVASLLSAPAPVSWNQCAKQLQANGASMQIMRSFSKVQHAQSTSSTDQLA